MKKTILFSAVMVTAMLFTGCKKDKDNDPPYEPWKAFGIEVVKIPAGTFTMGSPTTEPNRSDNETQHSVTLTKDFYMGKYQVTNTQFAAFLNAKIAEGKLGFYGETGDGNGKYKNAAYITGTTGEPLVYDTSDYNYKGVIRNSTSGSWSAASGYENHPVIYVTWYGAKAYADWVRGSLPTEAQWEYACRGDKGTLPFGIGTGKVLDGTMANIDGRYTYDLDDGGYKDLGEGNGTSLGKTSKIGNYSPNSYGLYDMHGNVWEWCSDWYDAGYGNSNATATDPEGPSTGSYRVARGGFWNNDALYCRSAYRDYAPPVNAFYTFGFRVVFVP